MTTRPPLTATTAASATLARSEGRSSGREGRGSHGRRAQSRRSSDGDDLGRRACDARGGDGSGPCASREGVCGCVEEGGRPAMTAAAAAPERRPACTPGAWAGGARGGGPRPAWRWRRRGRRRRRPSPAVVAQGRRPTRGWLRGGPARGRRRTVSARPQQGWRRTGSARPLQGRRAGSPGGGGGGGGVAAGEVRN